MNRLLHTRINVPRVIAGLGFLLAAWIMPSPASVHADSTRDIPPEVISPLMEVSPIPGYDGALEVAANPQIFDQLAAAGDDIRMSLPVSMSEEVLVELTRFEVVSPRARFLIATPSGTQPIDIPEVIMYRGRVADEPGSHVFLAFTEQGSGNGYITRATGRSFFMSHSADRIIAGEWSRFTISPEGPFTDLPDDVPFCAVEPPPDFVPVSVDQLKRRVDEPGEPRLARVAIDGDQSFCQIFGGNVYAAASYIVQLIGAISDIYTRDNEIKFSLDFVRLWPYGNEPFSATSLSSFGQYWWNTANPEDYHLMQLFSGRRDLGYGGIAYVGSTCYGGGFAIEGRFNGSFPSPFGPPDRGGWDITVVAHEMGHNFGTLHTHDGFDPPIDECGNGIPSRGTIMSYCHTHPGYELNMDMRFHALVQEVIENEIYWWDCYERDCNDNGIADYEDIHYGASSDLNYNNIPDECEDCNDNGVLDNIDIAGGEPDIDGNGIPDVCEPDCNGNSIPDEYEAHTTAFDLNGDNIPDDCEPDCNSNGFGDFVEIWIGASKDYDRNYIPDDCQDCDNNAVIDWLDMERQHFLYVSDASGNYIREYHSASGVPIRNLGVGAVGEPGYIAFGPDRQLYVSDIANDRVLRIDIENDITTTFVASGSGGLDQPEELLFAASGNLLVASYHTDNILEYDGSTGAYVGEFVPAGSGGLDQPGAIEIAPNGNLFVATGDNRVLEFDGASGSYVGEFVPAGGGGLSNPGGMTFRNNGNLLIVDIDSDHVLEFEDGTGAFIGQLYIPHSTSSGPTDIVIGPDRLIYVPHTGSQWVCAYLPHNGLFYGGFVRGDPYLSSPVSLAFRPPSSNDCNGNGIVDLCDIANGILHDVNSNSIPDECESGDADGDGIADSLDNCVWTPNPDQADADLDNFGDICDNCPEHPNPDQYEYDGDGVGEECDLCPGSNDHLDADGDGVPDGCDACPGYDDSIDSDGDGVPDPCDVCPGYDDFLDTDYDGLADGCDNCPDTANADQADSDGDGFGNACDICPGHDDAVDTDGDGVPDGCDICAGHDDNIDTDGDTVPDGCDICPGFDDYADGDFDTVPDSCDNCPDTPNTDQADSDGNGIGDACDFMCGDANDDETLNVSDAVYIITYIFKGGPAPDPLCVADANGDDTVNVSDAVYLIAYVFKGGPPPVIPCCP